MMLADPMVNVGSATRRLRPDLTMRLRRVGVGGADRSGTTRGSLDDCEQGAGDGDQRADELDHGEGLAEEQHRGDAPEYGHENRVIVALTGLTDRSPR